MLEKKKVEQYFAVILTLLAISISIGTASAAFTGHTGGPDYMGYTYKDSDSTVVGGPVYNWEEISTTGTQILPSSDDSYMTNIPVGFFFNYYGTDYSQVGISNNGLIFSGPSTGQYSNQPINASTPHGFIAPFWDDLVTWNNADAIYYKTEGTSPNRRFIVEWHDNQGYSSTPLGITFEAILYEGSNNILFQYQTVDFGSSYYNSGASATVGIEGPTGQGLQYSYNEAVLNPNLAILFKFPSFSGTNMVISKNAPLTKDHGTQMTYDLFYNNFGANFASNVVIVDNIPTNVEYVSSTPAGTYDSGTRTVTWNLGSVSSWPTGNGVVHVTVSIPIGVSIGAQISNTASISTTTLEERYDDNSVTIHTTVTGSGLPDGAGIATPNSGGNTPSVYYGNPTTFTFDSLCATNVEIRIDVNDGLPPIIAGMTPGPTGHWVYTITFIPRHGAATVTYTITGCTTTIVSYPIWIDPAGYIYDSVTLDRIAGATVTLMTMDDITHEWIPVPVTTPALIDPNTNPLMSDSNGAYAWLVPDGPSRPYRVHVTAPGYLAADSRIVNVPPPVFDLNVGLTPIGGTQPIPEFPTVALPIVSVLGIMFLMSRRKQ